MSLRLLSTPPRPPSCSWRREAGGSLSKRRHRRARSRPLAPSLAGGTRNQGGERQSGTECLPGPRTWSHETDPGRLCVGEMWAGHGPIEAASTHSSRSPYPDPDTPNLRRLRPSPQEGVLPQLCLGASLLDENAAGKNKSDPISLRVPGATIRSNRPRPLAPGAGALASPEAVGTTASRACPSSRQGRADMEVRNPAPTRGGSAMSQFARPSP